MATNSDIVKGDVPAYMNDTLRLFYAELQKGETDYAGMLTRLAVLVDSKARTNTANHIFADLKKHDTGYGDIVVFKEELRELEKKYGVD